MILIKQTNTGYVWLNIQALHPEMIENFTRMRTTISVLGDRSGLMLDLFDGCDPEGEVTALVLSR
jgi:hypothetical protein